MRGTIFGRGLAQVLACAALLAVPALLFGLDWRAALIIGLGLALLSTALVMREIDEGGERDTPFGQTAIALLLFEDLAIIPLLLLVTLLAHRARRRAGPMMRALALGLGAIALLITIGRYALDPMFRVIARTRTPELMTAAALGVVVFAALSMALSSQFDRAYRLVARGQKRETIDETYSDADGSVLVIGFGRVGQLVAQPLLERYNVTLLDHDADRIREAKRFGARVHFGDGTRPEVLQAAGAIAPEPVDRA